MNRLSGALIGLLPSLTMVTGIFGTALAAPFTTSRGNMFWALAFAVAAPAAAAIVLRIVFPGHDPVLVGVAGMLVAVGVATVYGLSTLPGIAGDFYSSIATRHAMYAGTGFVVLIAGALAARGLNRIQVYPVSMLVVAVLLIVVTIVFGETVNGARLWLGVGPLRFQPSEIARLLIALFVATFLFDRRYLLTAPWRFRRYDLPPAPYLLPLAGAVAIAIGVLGFQNDLGMAALVTLGAAASVIAVLGSRAAVAVAVIVIAGGLAGAYAAAPRVRERVVGWLDPWIDPAGRGYQFVQAEFSLAAGGLFGQNPALAAGDVPEVHTDLILVAIGNQFGLPVSLATLSLAAVLVIRCMSAGFQSRDGFRSLAAVSLAALLATQLMLIIGGSLRVLPLTGLTFPLVSYGGTSMIVTQFTLGVVVGIGTGTSNARATFRTP